MPGQDRFDRVLVHLYKAALADAEWASAAALINDMIRTNGHSLTYAGVGPGGEPMIHLARFFVGPQRRHDYEQAAVLGLTPAESRVAVELATGQTIAGIADAQDCAESTVRTHLKRVYRKQGIRKQTELVRRVLSLDGLRKRFR